MMRSVASWTSRAAAPVTGNGGRGRWHPGGTPGVGGRIRRFRYEHIELTKAHLPTNRISLEEFLRLGIESLGIPPRRDDWQETLGATQDAFERWRTWG
jgi:hypothetical protein